jgi:alpha-tubulin suppressor-like RCC1 family protein
MKRIFGILFALVLVVSLGLVTASPVLADVSPGWAGIVQVSAGGLHTVGLKSGGTVVAVGLDFYGALEVDDWTGIDQVDAGPYHTVGLKNDGTVVAVGWDNCDITAVGDWTNIDQVAAGDYHTVGLRSDHTVIAVGCGAQCDVGNWTTISQVDAGQVQTVGLKPDGTVVAAGDNYWGECDVSGWTDIGQVSAGYCHTVGLKSDGTVVATGDNEYGQCEVDGWTDIIQISAGGDTVGLKSDGTVITTSTDYDVSGWTNIIQVSTADGYTVGLKSDHTVIAVGDNTYGQCGHIVTETVTDDIVDATGEADTQVLVDGTAMVTVFQYDSNPGGSAPTDFKAFGKWIDVYVPDYGAITEIEIRLYYTDDESDAADVDEELLELLWWDDDEWRECSDSGVNTANTGGYSGYMWAKIRSNTTPSLADLQGTEFGGYGHPSGTPGGGCFIATAAYGTDTATEIDILREFRNKILLPNSLGAKFVSLYYKVSPPIANFISQYEVLRTAVRVGFVDPIVKVLTWTHALWSAKGS